jgi:hypothetical protein
MRAAAWSIERQHLQAQINRERAASAASRARREASCKLRRQRIQQAWLSDDELYAAAQQGQVGIARHDAELRAAEESRQEAHASIKSETTRVLLNSKREHVVARSQAIDQQMQRRGAVHWKIGMESGARMVGLEKSNEVSTTVASALLATFSRCLAWCM